MNPLLETGLLGTGKKLPDMDILPGDLREKLTGKSADPETLFLEASSYFHFYQEAGSLPMAFDGELNDSVIEEEFQPGPVELHEMFRMVDQLDYQIREKLFNQWISVFVERKVIIKAELIYPVLVTGKNYSNATKKNILQAIGNKGRWLLGQQDELNYASPSRTDNTWIDGDNNERRDLFLTLRKNDPLKSIDLLRSTWGTEPVVTKKTFLEIISNTSVKSDISFIEELLSTEFAFKSKEKKTEKECRRILTSILLKFPESRLYAETTQALRRYVEQSRKGIMGFITGKESVSINIPIQEDDFWNAMNMEQIYGFEKKSIDIAIYSTPTLFWLGAFLNDIPMSFWAGLFDGDYKRCVSYFLENDRFKIKDNGKELSIYQPVIKGHCLHHRDATLVLVLINQLDARECLPLLSMLDADEYESFILRNKYYDDPEFLANGPFDLEHSWSYNFSEKILTYVYEQITQNKGPAYYGKVIVQYIHSDCDNLLLRYHEKARDTTTYHTWKTLIFEPVYTALEFRKKINVYKTNKS